MFLQASLEKQDVHCAMFEFGLQWVRYSKDNLILLHLESRIFCQLFDGFLANIPSNFVIGIQPQFQHNFIILS